MTGTFSSVNQALTALRYQQVAMDVASGNVANVSSDGYVRRRVAGEAVGAPAQPAMWSRYDGTGEGVRVSGIQRMVDPLLDARARREHGSQAYLDVRQAVLERVETGLGEPGDTGVAAALSAFRKSWHDLANNPGSEATRSQVLSSAATLVDAIKLQSRNVTAEEGDLRFRALVTADEVNVLAADLASTNKSIAVATLNGTEAGTLLDKRDQLALRLSELTGSVATQQPDGTFTVTVDGAVLVKGQDAAKVTVTGIDPADTSATGTVGFSVVTASGSTDVAPGGEAGALRQLLNTTLPAYRSDLGAVARSLADTMNAQHAKGYDRAGVQGGPLFAYDATDVAGTITLAFTEPDLVAASGMPGGVLDAGNAELMAAGILVEDDYQRLVSGFGSEVASARRLATNQQTLTAQVDGAREQLSGVNLDEEMVSMLSAQRAYEAAARVMTTVDSVLDTLINRTGLVR